MTPEREAELRALATNQDWAPAQHEDLAELFAEIDELRGHVTEFEAEREWRTARTERGGPEMIWAIGGLDGYIMVNVSEEGARREADRWPDRVALWAERTAWRDSAVEEPKP